MYNRSRNTKKKQAKFHGVPQYLSPRSKRLKKFSCKGRDGREMKIYLGTGCVPTDYGINEFVEKFPQFAMYDKVSLGSAFNRLKKSANSIAFERGSRSNKNRNGREYMYKQMVFSLLFFLLPIFDKKQKLKI